jgi:hypothetical protein
LGFGVKSQTQPLLIAGKLALFAVGDPGNDGILENFILDENALSTLQTDCEQQGQRLLRMGKKMPIYLDLNSETSAGTERLSGATHYLWWLSALLTNLEVISTI